LLPVLALGVFAAPVRAEGEAAEIVDRILNERALGTVLEESGDSVFVALEEQPSESARLCAVVAEYVTFQAPRERAAWEELVLRVGKLGERLLEKHPDQYAALLAAGNARTAVLELTIVQGRPTTADAWLAAVVPFEKAYATAPGTGDALARAGEVLRTGARALGANAEPLYVRAAELLAPATKRHADNTH
jgi:hypothetical protein